MKNKFIILLLLILLLPTFALADLGPKPSADIHVTINEKIIPDSFNAKMLSCQNKDNQYSNRDLIPEFNVSVYDSYNGCYWQPAELAWGGNCQDSNCHFNYFLPDKFRLAVYLPSLDKVYLSDEIERNNFRSTFTADLKSDGTITIQETTSYLQSDSSKKIKNFFIALFLTLTLELFVALIFILITKIHRRLLISVVLASIISLPIVWFIFPLLKPFALAIILAEIFAFVFEAYFIYFLNKKIITLKQSFLLSFIMNLVSLIIGGYILLIISIISYF